MASGSEREATTRLVDRWKAGDESAAGAIVNRYSSDLCAVAEQRLQGLVARRIDPEEVAFSALQSFFRRSRGGEFVIDRPGQLWRLLRRMTRNKAVNQLLYHKADRRDVRRERVTGDEMRSISSPGPSPEDETVIAEIVAVVLSECDASAAQVFQMRLQGHAVEEIAQAIGCSRWTVRRKLDAIGERIKAQLQHSTE